MPELTPGDFDTQVLVDDDLWRVVFFWGKNCPNCEVAKRMLHEEMAAYKSFPFLWSHVNTYEYPDLGIRFGLHGIPTFLFFRKGRLRGRATSFPGHDEFLLILNRLSRE